MKQLNCGNWDHYGAKLTLLSLITLCPGYAMAQKTISGTVTDTNGEPIIGASVLVKGTSQGVVTDLDGRYILKDVADKATLSISYVGYKPQNISTNGQCHSPLRE